jgi:DNA-binding transcriptional ArsR family regulator
MARKKQAAVENAQDIALLASSTRIDIVDTLEAFGRAVSVAELAAQLGRSADGLYYHLRQLADGGLIEESLIDDVRYYRSRSRQGDRLRLRYQPGNTENAEAVAHAVSSLLRVSDRDFRRALADPDCVVEGPHRQLWAARGKGWVRKEELAEINVLLERLMDLVQRPRDDDDAQLVSITWVLAPVDVKPLRRQPKVAVARKKRD